MSAKKKQPATTRDILLYLIALYMPPFSVGILRGCGGQIILNIILTMCFYFPGVIHSLVIVSRGDKIEDKPQDVEKGRNRPGAS